MRKKAPNFLLPWQYERFPFSSVFFLGLLLVLFIFLLQFNTAVAVVLFGAGAVLFLSLHLEWGLYVLMAVGFFHGWEINLSEYQSLRGVPYLAGINAPVVDFFAIMLFLAVVTSVAFRFAPINWRSFLYVFPGWVWYGLFLLAAGISALYAFEGAVGQSVKYLLRPMAFVYLMFVGLVCVILQRRHVLDRVFHIWFWAGSLIATFGLAGFFRSLQFGGWPRAVPFDIAGFAPLGYNHNLLAEVLVAIIPIALFLTLRANKDMRPLYAAGTIGMIGVALLTLSRAAWLSLALGAAVLLYWYGKRVVGWLKTRAEAMYLIGVAGLIGLVYMVFFLGSNVVSSSNEARIVSTDIAVHYATRSPIIGYGPGTFISILGSTAIYTADFGDPLDAHGFIQKIMLEEGVLGLILFILFLFVTLRALWRRQSHGKEEVLFRMLFVSCLSAVTFQLFNTSYFNANMWLPIGVALAALQLSKFGENYAFKKR